MDAKYLVFYKAEGEARELPLIFPVTYSFETMAKHLQDAGYSPLRGGLCSFAWSGMFECRAAKSPEHLAELRQLRVGSMLAADTALLNTHFP